jgi:hypothetical protein
MLLIETNVEYILSFFFFHSFAPIITSQTNLLGLSHLTWCSKRVNIRLGVRVGNAADPSSSFDSIASLVDTQVQNSAAWYLIREEFQGAQGTTDVRVAQCNVDTSWSLITDKLTCILSVTYALYPWVGPKDLWLRPFSAKLINTWWFTAILLLT